MFDNTNSGRPWLQSGPFSPEAIAAKGQAQGPAKQQTPAPNMVPAPFVPEQMPPMLPFQQPMQMPAGKGIAQGPMIQQSPMQQFQGGGKPVDLQALIQSLMASGLLGGL